MLPMTYDYIKLGNARSGIKMARHLFGVAHDTGNPGSTARQNRGYFQNSNPFASAHIFTDDKEKLVIVPLDEKAWHNRYGNEEDNEIFGDDANDVAIGVELCYGGKINFAKAYQNYVEVWAWLCEKYKWNPRKQIAAHATLDPRRRTDPHNALNKHGITFNQFIAAVEKEMGRAPEVVQVSNPASNISDERLKIKVLAKDLHTYTKTDWNAKNGAPLVHAGEVFTVKRTLSVDGGKMYELISGWFITANPKYVQVVKVATPKPKQKYVQILAASLWTYGSKNFSDREETVRKGEVFTVIGDKFAADGGHMYKLKSGLYVTANPKYVKEFTK